MFFSVCAQFLVYKVFSSIFRVPARSPQCQKSAKIWPKNSVFLAFFSFWVSVRNRPRNRFYKGITVGAVLKKVQNYWKKHVFLHSCSFAHTRFVKEFIEENPVFFVFFWPPTCFFGSGQEFLRNSVSGPPPNPESMGFSQVLDFPAFTKNIEKSDFFWPARTNFRIL